MRTCLYAGSPLKQDSFERVQALGLEGKTGKTGGTERAKRAKRHAIFSARSLPVKRNRTERNGNGNGAFFLTPTVHDVGPQELLLSVGYGSICMVVCWTMCHMIVALQKREKVPLIACVHFMIHIHMHGLCMHQVYSTCSLMFIGTLLFITGPEDCSPLCQ